MTGGGSKSQDDKPDWYVLDKPRRRRRIDWSKEDCTPPPIGFEAVLAKHGIKGVERYFAPTTREFVFWFACLDRNAVAML